MTDISRLTRTRARDVWAHEARDFTPWLLQNADALGEVLGMDLELTRAEHSVGQFSLDLIGRDVSTGESVIVENQLERSDHNHLGQILTYAGGTDAVNVVWIADEIRSEHRAALDWLNDRTDERTRFFAVEISAVRIGDSAYAPLFEVVVQPNDWSKEVRAEVVVAGHTATQERYREFWARFLDELHQRFPGWTNTRKALPQNWMNLPLGSSVANMAVVGTQEFLRVEIYFTSPSSDVNEANFHKVEQHKAALESALGAALTWDVLEGKKGCRISIVRNGGIGDEAKWPEQMAWLVDTAGRLRAAIDSLGGLPALLSD